MNVVLDARYSEAFHRLAAGVEPVDAVTGARAPDGVAVLLEAVPRPLGTWRRFPAHTDLHRHLPRAERHGSGRFAVRHGRGVGSPLDVRVVDLSGRRRYVPRRLRLPVPDEAAVVAAERDPAVPDVTTARRSFAVALAPGAGAALPGGATGLRGRVVDAADRPVRWARVEARTVTFNGPGPVVGRASGDDRGEFCLLVVRPPGPAAPADPMRVAVRVLATAAPAPPTGAADLFEGALDRAPAAEPARTLYLRSQVIDPLWDLPVETLAVPGGARDPVAAGIDPPTGYVPAADGDVEVDLPLGRMATAPPFPFTT